ncbi:hypothetical protein Phum_PHUM284910 [Pediculus humanus corporis]|uniref:Uncharacterized protein n=1 Tax=Pediculus humanus subsp. corporis TaxID=121224 RepID=E0VL99_PEDHC|nr:uncharacterized protein Phum_PHUM284910 [Pediculus humanus corporis]EEB14155.1 hypothetical protein Phum_PHUM284910 [Pediculus humanus corporis]
MPEPVRSNVTSRKKKKRVCHPFCCRLRSSARGLDVTSSNSLISAGFTSLGLAFLSAFRYTPLILYYLSDILSEHGFKFYYYACTFTIFGWSGILLITLVIFGIILSFSTKIKHKGILLLHPWCLLLLYFDVFVWIGLDIILEPVLNEISDELDGPFYYLLVTYIDNAIFFVIYWVYATYFILAELTIIENNFR